MKEYTHTEIINSQLKLPRPVADFLNSDSITKIVSGIAKKLDLTPEQKLAVTDIITATLTKLEPESALETNIHQLIHELSNEKTRELAADIRDRVFREAERRERENIIDATVSWDEGELGAPPTAESLERTRREEAERKKKFSALSVEEIQRLADEEIRLAEEREDREDAEYAKAQANAPKGAPIPEISPEAQKILSEAFEAIAEVEKNETAGTGAPTIPNAATTETSSQQLPSIANEKLGTPTIARNKAERVLTLLNRPGVTSVSVPPSQQPSPIEEPRKRLPANPIKKVDPYREPFE